MTFTYDQTDFLLDGKPFRLLSGAIHYFRIPKQCWHDRLLKLKECGLNTVETYVAWNAHEKEEGVFDFTDMLDLGAFLDTAAELGLYAIVRPGPYICAEWEGGGLPAWLLNIPGLRIRCDNQPYLQRVRAFFEQLFAVLVPRLCTKGGNILMLQVENEYGSYGDDCGYLRKLEQLYRDLGADCLLFRADGDDPTMMHAAETGTAENPGLFVADNFGSDPTLHAARMQELGYRLPMFCGEYWCGWFDHWGERHHRRSASDVARETELFLQQGAHFNYYMFCGGTNFGFWSGANEIPGGYAPTTTSYDYDSLLSEAGDRTEKYYAVRDVLSKYVSIPPLTATESKKTAYGQVKLTGSALLFSHLQQVQGSVYTEPHPRTFEEAGCYWGYLLYETELTSPHGKELIPDRIADRLSVYADGTRIGVLEHEAGPTSLTLPEGDTHLSILCENRGRVNYGATTLDRKGLSAVRTDQRIHNGWKTVCLPMEDLSGLTFDEVCQTEQPAFHRALLQIDGEPADTFLSMRGWHKGFVTVNGHNLGRYDSDKGPQYTLYVPACFLQPGENQILLFESEKSECDRILFADAPDFDE